MELKLTQLGIVDYDGYGILWYGHYVKWMRRALPRPSELLHLRFVAPLEWGEDGAAVHVYAVDATTALVQIRVGETRKATALFRCAVADAGSPLVPPLQRVVKGLRASATVLPKAMGAIETTYQTFGSATEHDVLDWFEQTRTRAIGGQGVLRSLPGRIVVVQLDGLVVGTVPDSEATIVCLTTFHHHGWLVLSFKQEVLCRGKVVASMLCKLFYVEAATQRAAPLPSSVRKHVSNAMQMPT